MDFKIGNLVRFANEKDGGPVHRIVSVMSDGMIELHDHGGYFAPHLFVEATDIADIPPNHKTDLVDSPPERIWVVGQENLIGFAKKSAITRFYASNLDHGEEYPEYVRADLYEKALKERREAEAIGRGWEDRFHAIRKRETQ